MSRRPFKIAYSFTVFGYHFSAAISSHRHGMKRKTTSGISPQQETGGPSGLQTDCGSGNKTANAPGVTLCPECGAPWSMYENRCTANCQAIDKGAA